MTSNPSPSHMDSFLQKNHLGSIPFSSLQHLTVQTTSGAGCTFLPPTNKSRKDFLPDTEAGGGGAEVGSSGWHKREQNPKAWPSQIGWPGRGLYTLTPSSAFSCASLPTPPTGREGGWGKRGGLRRYLAHPPRPPAPLNCPFQAPAFEPPHGPPFASSNESPRLCI